MRCDQPMGLNKWARDLVSRYETASEEVVRTYPDGSREQFTREVRVEIAEKIPSGNCYHGMFGDEYPLMTYKFPNGEVYTEYLQADPWSSGPMMFLALRDQSGKSVPESLWTNEEMSKY